MIDGVIVGSSSYSTFLSSCHCCLFILSFTTNNICWLCLQPPQYFQGLWGPTWSDSKWRLLVYLYGTKFNT